MNNKDSATALTQALEEMKHEQGYCFSFDKINLTELGRRTGISRKKLQKERNRHEQTGLPGARRNALLRYV